METMLTTKDVCKLLGVSSRFVGKKMATGELRCVKLGSKKNSPVRFEAAEVEAYIAKMREASK